jgi:hypothetical protein
LKEELAAGLSPALQNVIRPLLKSVGAISQQIAEYDLAGRVVLQQLASVSPVRADAVDARALRPGR